MAPPAGRLDQVTVSVPPGAIVLGLALSGPGGVAVAMGVRLAVGVMLGVRVMVGVAVGPVATVTVLEIPSRLVRRNRHTSSYGDWSSTVCAYDPLVALLGVD